MFELLYTSVSPQGLSDADLLQLLEKARTKNQQLGITGMMVYYNREIMQLLEGEKSVVQGLYETIFSDNRHTRVDIFYEGDIETRAFSAWSMAFKSLDSVEAKNITAGCEGIRENSSPIFMLKNSPNRGRKAFISLRDGL